MVEFPKFDVFLAHNSQEKAKVEKIREQLKQRGIYAWLDKHDFEPFRRWQDQLEEILPKIKAVAIFIGSSGVGPWQDIEMKEFLVEFTNRNIRMGLVILPECPDELINTVPRFMKSFHWVDFRQLEPDPMEQLIWGITGVRRPDNLFDRERKQDFPHQEPGKPTPSEAEQKDKKWFLVGWAFWFVVWFVYYINNYTPSGNPILDIMVGIFSCLIGSFIFWWLLWTVVKGIKRFFTT